MCGYGSFLPKNAFFESFTYAGSRNTLNEGEFHTDRVAAGIIGVNACAMRRGAGLAASCTAAAVVAVASVGRAIVVHFAPTALHTGSTTAFCALALVLATILSGVLDHGGGGGPR